MEEEEENKKITSVFPYSYLGLDREGELLTFELSVAVAAPRSTWVLGTQ